MLRVQGGGDDAWVIQLINMKSLPSILLYLILLVSAQAKLGETKYQIEKRYGPALGLPDTNKISAGVYSFKGHQIAVTFFDGKSVQEGIFLNPQTEPASTNESIAFAAAITGTKPEGWVRDNEKGETKFTCGEFVMDMDKDDGGFCIIITTAGFYKETEKAMAQARAARSKKILEDFGK